MRAWTGLWIALLIGLVGVPASAKDVCVEQGSQVLVFRKVKPLKKAGSIVPLSGLFIIPGDFAPFNGTAYVRADGQVLIGVTVYGHLNTSEIDDDLLIEMVGDASFDMDGVYYSVRNDVTTAGAWTPIDCKTVTLP